MNNRKIFAFNVVVYHWDTEFRDGRPYVADCPYAPDKKPQDEWWGWMASDKTSTGLTDIICSYVKENVMNGHCRPEQIAIINLPLTKDDFGGDIHYYSGSLGSCLNWRPWTVEEFSALQQALGRDFPQISGLPGRPYGAIPMMPVEEQMVLEFQSNLEEAMLPDAVKLARQKLDELSECYKKK